MYSDKDSIFSWINCNSTCGDGHGKEYQCGKVRGCYTPIGEPKYVLFRVEFSKDGTDSSYFHLVYNVEVTATGRGTGTATSCHLHLLLLFLPATLSFWRRGLRWSSRLFLYSSVCCYFVIDNFFFLSTMLKISSLCCCCCYYESNISTFM